MKPTDNQIEEFWKWCGFIESSRTDINNEAIHCWKYPDGDDCSLLPRIDLGNLFKYAVSSLDKITLSQNKRLAVNTDCPWRTNVEVMIDKSLYFCGRLIINELWGMAYSDNDPALALFWAIWEIIEKDKK